jgi:hypothetical protein
MKKSISAINLKGEFKLISEVRDIVINEYAITIKAVQNTSERLELGISLLVLKSIYNHLTSIESLIEDCSIESCGAVATSLWEKSIMLQYLLCEPKERFKSYASHNSFKKLPWSIKDMVRDIVKRETLPENRTIEDVIDMFYLQYSYLCAIKHGNPYTLSYLNRLTPDEDFFKPKLQISSEDIDILGWIYLNVVTNFFDVIMLFAKIFTTDEQYKKLQLIDKEISSKYFRRINLRVPQIISTSPKEFRKEFWDYLLEIDAKIQSK